MAVPIQFRRTPTSSRTKAAKSEDSDSLLRSLGHSTVSGLQYAGETLNKPSRALWGSLNALAGGDDGGGLLNLIPFSDAMGLTDPHKGIEASQFLENRGILPKNKAGFDALDLVRFGADVIGDPTSYLSFGASALGKGGQVVKKAGGLKGLSRVGRITSDVATEAARVAPDALQRAAKASGYVDSAAMLAQRGSEKAGGLVGVGLPFKAPSFAIGTGPTAQKIGGALDKLGEVARYGKFPGTQFSPGQQLARVFSPAAMGLHTPEIAKRATELPAHREGIIKGTRGAVAKDVSELARHGALDDETSMLGRAYGEGVLDINKLPVEKQAKARLAAKLTDPWKKKLYDAFVKARTLGIRVERHGDPANIGYMPRFFVDKLHNAANTMGREDYLIGFKEGTEQLRKAYADPQVLDGGFEDAVSYVKRSYPAVVSDVPKAEIVRREGEVIGSAIDPAKWEAAGRRAQQNSEDLVHSIRNATPEQRSVGGFGRNWLEDIQDALIGMDWKAKRAETMLDSLADIARPTRDIPAVAGGETRTVGEILDAAGLEPVTKVTKPHPVSGTHQEVGEGALRHLARKLGKQPYNAAHLDEIAGMRLPADQADDLVRLMKGDDIKQVFEPLMQAFDSMTNLFKVGVLAWPARHVRDRTSGMAMNVLTGNFDPAVSSAVHTMVAGGVADFTDIPAVQKMLAEQGLEATAENSTEMMRQLFYTYEKHSAVSGARGAGEVVGEASGALPGGTQSFAAEFPGRDPVSPLSPSTLNAGAPVNTRAAWSPLNVRGVLGKIKTEAKLPAISERMGRYTDSMNRGEAFVTNLKRGVEPEQASQIADALQVNYSPRNFTAAERKYLKRAFPFYSFTAKLLPEVTKQLTEHPGGGIAQSLRAANSLRGDEPVPDYVGQTLAIPLGETEGGDKSYLTALQFMHEPIVNLPGMQNGAPSLQATTRNVLSQLNPYPKGLAELAFGKTLFQNRELSEADPTIGRLISNVSDIAGLGKREMPSGRAKPFINTTTEQLLANSPISRLTSSLRQATDKRKWEGGPFPGSKAALNLLTGAKISDISPAAQDAMLRDQLQELAKSEGASAFEDVRYSKAQISEAEKENPAAAARMRALNAAAAELAARAKKRKAKITPPKR